MQFVDLVNIKQGTDSVRRFSRGNTLPLVCLPNALNMFSPQTDSSRGPWFYHPADRSFEGVRLTHQPSPWAGDYSYICFLPQTDKFVVDPTLRWSGFRPENTVLKPYFMQYDLLRYRTTLSLVPTNSGAIMEINAEESDKRPIFSIIPHDFNTEITVDKQNRMVTGYTCPYTEAPFHGDFKFYFTVAFDCDIEDVEFKPVGAKASAVGVFLSAKKYNVRVAGSFLSVDQAKLNLHRELEGKTLEDLLVSARNEWESLLSRIQIEGDEKMVKTFYSCLYRACVYPNKFYEIGADGLPYHVVPQTGEIKKGVAYTNNGFWDTYRTVYPLYSIFRPEILEEIVRGYLNIYDDIGVLPRWLCPSEANYMPGTLIESVFADLIAKDILSEETKNRVLKAVLKNVEHISDEKLVARKCAKEYNSLGYVPCDMCKESVCETLDSAYGDFCISVIAEKCGRKDIAQKFLARSNNYVNIFDSKTGFMRPKLSSGEFKQPFDPFDWGEDYTEGGAWQNSFAVPHDYEGLANLHGGKENFLKKIDELFKTKPYYTVNGYPLEIHEMTEMASVDFGQCAISNQPSFHIPFMYAEFGDAQKSKEIVKKMVETVFSYEDGGFPGDEDNGTMASWYIFAVLGFYPTCPGKTRYTVSGALVSKATLVTENGKVDLIKAINDKNFVEHSELTVK